MSKRIGFLYLFVLIASVSGAAEPAQTQSWDAYWASKHVSPAPPRDFMDGPPYTGQILNLTDGRLSDKTVKAWILADLRRANADTWATHNLRRDVADAGIFGPPGLNGTSAEIDAEIAKGTERIDSEGFADTIAAAVIYVPAMETNVIVFERRLTGKPRFRTLKSGAREPLGKPMAPGTLIWRIDTGHFFKDPVLGDLWYQTIGATCHPNDGTPVGDICARVPPVASGE